MQKTEKVTRRGLLKGLMMALVAFPLAGVFKGSKAFAGACAPAPAGIKAVTAEDATGKRLEYVFTAAESKNKLYKAGNQCDNCKFYKADKANAGWAPCTMMANKFVTGCGWCKSYKATA